MIPVTIPDELIAPGTVRRVIAAPDGDLLNDEIRPVEALIKADSDGIALLSMKLQLEDGDLGRLIRGGTVWLTMRGAVAPFDIQVLEDGQVP